MIATILSFLFRYNLFHIIYHLLDDRYAYRHIHRPERIKFLDKNMLSPISKSYNEAMIIIICIK